MRRINDLHVAERQATWQTWRTWLGERKEDLRAPCQAACPVGTNAGLYVSLIAQGRYDEALQVASEPNPFPAICGRVCTAPCEDACRRGEFDLPIAIRDLKRFAMDNGVPRKRKVTPPKQWYSERVAIVGAGPTGLSAAYYLARRGYRVTVFDAMPVAGGMMSIGIPDYRLPREELNRGGGVSDYPREDESARYWVQTSLGQGQSSSIYDGSGDDEQDGWGAVPKMAAEMNREAAENAYKCMGSSLPPPSSRISTLILILN